MLTPFGKELRKLRIDRELRLGQMAKMLDVSAAFLSAVETGRKKVPQDMIKDIAKKLKLAGAEMARLEAAATDSPVSVRIPLAQADSRSRDLAVGFARRFPTLTEQEKESLHLVLFSKGS